MTDHEPVIPLSERVKPQQLTRSDLKGLTAEEINQARMAGQLEDALSGKKPAPPTSPPVESDTEKVARLLREGRS